MFPSSPRYTDKLRAAVEVIDNELSHKKQFNFADVNRSLDFDCHRCVRLLGRLGYLKPIQDASKKRIVGFVRTKTWPPPKTFFQSGPVGVAHYIQKWFRFKLQEWIVSRMREVESKEGVYSIEGWLDYRHNRIFRDENQSDCCHLRECVPSLIGEYQDRTGAYLAADVSMIEKPLDISQMTIEWVNSTEDLLFKNLTNSLRNMDHHPGTRFITTPRPRKGFAVVGRGWLQLEQLTPTSHVKPPV